MRILNGWRDNCKNSANQYWRVGGLFGGVICCLIGILVFASSLTALVLLGSVQIFANLFDVSAGGTPPWDMILLGFFCTVWLFGVGIWFLHRSVKAWGA